MVTSNLWILLSDFAVFKPTYLPDDNPSDFSFFFDTSRRRTCNVAPERFVSEELLAGNLGVQGSLDILSVGNNGQQINSETCAGVTPHMDLFSLGCILSELFSEATDFQLFDLSSILLYKSGDQEFIRKVNERLDSVISDEQIRLLIKNLISLDPAERNSTTQHLMELTPSLFPNTFNILFDYIKDLMHLSPDSKILRLESDLNSLVNAVLKEEAQCLLLILVILTSNLRSLKHVYAKICCLRLIMRVVDADHSLMSGYILDRVLPYILCMVTDNSCPSVRREALETLTHVLSLVKEVSPSENNVFIDYILPVLNKVTLDKSSFVRASLSSNLASLSETAMRFFQSSSNDGQGASNNEVTNSVTNISNTEEEMIESFKDMISHLLTDPSNEVKRALLDTNISKLCAFLGKTRTNDVILSHIITFLNDKEDFELRASFFDNIVPIAAFLGSQCSSILRPLLQQGLSDAEEYVIHRTLQSLTTLTSLKFLDKSLLFQLLGESSPLLSHPNPWIRDSLIAYLITLSEQLSLAETHCKLMPMIKKSLKKELNVLSADLVTEYLKPPLTRDLYSMIISKNVAPVIVEAVFDILKDQQHMRSIQTRHHPHPNPSALMQTNPSLCLYQKLKDNGMTEEVEEQLIDLSDIMIRISRNKSRSHPTLPQVFQKQHRRNGSNSSIKSDQSNDIRIKDPSFVMIDTSSSQRYGSNKVVKLHVVPLIDDEKKVTTRIRAMTMSNMNDEWKHMFGSYPTGTESTATTDVGGSMTATLTQSDTNSSATTIEAVLTDAQMTNVIPVAHEAHELDYEILHTSCPPCLKNQRNLITHKKDSYEFSLWSRGVDLSNLSSMGVTESFKSNQRVSSSGVRPRGCLIAHLHEHSKGVNKIIAISNTNYFATCSDDGSIKTWDAGRIEAAKLAINKSFQTIYSKDLSPIETMAYISSLDTVIAVSSKSEAHFFRFDSAQSKLRQEHSFNLSSPFGDDGSSVTSVVTDVVSSSPFCFAVSFSNSILHGYDLRTDISSGPAFNLSIDLRHGFVTSITGTEYVIFAASSSGTIYTFDTRFLMRSSTVSYNESRRIRKLLFTPIGLFSSGNVFYISFLFELESNLLFLLFPDSQVQQRSHAL
jgi:phosphoinositide-3-kinase regulatory subunit 4